MDPSYLEFAEVTAEFLQTAIEYILYLRSVYPGMFERSMKYGVSIHRSSKQLLSEYIYKLTHSLKPNLLDGKLSKVILVIKRLHQISESYTFQFTNWRLSLHDIDIPQIRRQFKIILQSLANLELKNDFTSCCEENEPLFNVEIELFNGCCEITGENWTPIENGGSFADGNLTPVRSADLGIFKLQLFGIEFDGCKKDHSHQI